MTVEIAPAELSLIKYVLSGVAAYDSFQFIQADFVSADDQNDLISFLQAAKTKLWFLLPQELWAIRKEKSTKKYNL